jgi:hypothetical protein
VIKDVDERLEKRLGRLHARLRLGIEAETRFVENQSNINRTKGFIQMELEEPLTKKRSLGALHKAPKTKPRSADMTGTVRLQREKQKEKRMWSIINFSKHKGKSLPEVILHDPDWFFLGR